MAPDSETPPGYRRWIVAGVVAVVTCAGVGWWVGDMASDPPPPVRQQAIDLAGVQVPVPPGWTLARDSEQSRDVRTFAPSPGLPAQVTLSLIRSDDPSLLPPELRAELPRELPPARRTTLGGLTAWSYGPVPVGRYMRQVTVAPTTAGNLAVECLAPAWTWSVVADCQGDVHAVELGEGRAIDPSSELPFRTAAAAVLEPFDRRRVAGRERLHDRDAPNRRAAVARTLWRLHADAAAELQDVAVPGPSARVVHALRAAARGYRELGEAANAGRRGRYDAARRAVERADARMAAALDVLRR